LIVRESCGAANRQTKTCGQRRHRILDHR
jgi:hypothetical protein